MYLDYYGFTEKPFAITPNPRFIFFSEIHKEAFALLLYGINGRFGFIELIGEVGTGKTTVLRTMLNQLGDDTHRIALIFNPSQSAVDLMRAINREYGIPADSENIADLLDELNRFLLRENSAGHTVILVIDEAQNLSPLVLEQVRLISNLETDTDKLIQIILAGQPELEKVLDKPELRQLNQRIALRYRLVPLRRREAFAYIEHRIAIAGGGHRIYFTAAAVALLYRFSGGIPRIINILCDRALLIAYTGNRNKISFRTMLLARRDVKLKPEKQGLFRLIRNIALPSAMIIVLGIAFTFGAFRKQTDLLSLHMPPAAATAPAVHLQPSIPPSPAAKHVPTAPAAAPDAPPAANQQLPVKSAELPEPNPMLQAFDEVAAFWHTIPLKSWDTGVPMFRELQQQVRKRGLEVYRFDGSIADLAHYDIPILIQLRGDGSHPGGLVAITGYHDGQLQVSPKIRGRSSFRCAELDAIRRWPSYMVWRNSEKIPTNAAPGKKGPGIINLQSMLQIVGYPYVMVNGTYDADTSRAIGAFQSSHGLRKTGGLDPVTLMLIYKTLGETKHSGVEKLHTKGSS